MGFSRQEYSSGLPFPSPGDIPDPGIEPMSPALQADALTYEPPGKPLCCCCCCCVTSVVSDSVRPQRRQPTRLLRPWDFPGKSTGVGCHCLLHSLNICSTIYQYDTTEHTYVNHINKTGEKPKVGLKHMCRWGSGAEVCFFLSQDLEQWLVPSWGKFFP